MSQAKPVRRAQAGGQQPTAILYLPPPVAE